MTEYQPAAVTAGRGELAGIAGCAVVLGAEGRVGGAFARRLHREGYLVLKDPVDPVVIARAAPRVFLFDCAYRDGDPEGHVQRVAEHLGHWREFAGIFVPSSAWIMQDHAYGRAKRVVEELAAFYRVLGANVVTDRIGYFPGDGIAADPAEPMIDQLIDGDTLYMRVMGRLLAGVAAPA